MPISRNHVDKLLADCGPRCCICRRFKPLQLQVHHIQPLGDGGGDGPENLIALCVTCHSSVHTKSRMTRNFTVAELKQHRDHTVAAVREGRLVEPSGPPKAFKATPRPIPSNILPSLAQPTTPRPQFMPEATEMLMAAAKHDQPPVANRGTQMATETLLSPKWYPRCGVHQM